MLSYLLRLPRPWPCFPCVHVLRSELCCDDSCCNGCFYTNLIGLIFVPYKEFVPKISTEKFSSKHTEQKVPNELKWFILKCSLILKGKHYTTWIQFVYRLIILTPNIRYANWACISRSNIWSADRIAILDGTFSCILN